MENLSTISVKELLADSASALKWHKYPIQPKNWIERQKQLNILLLLNKADRKLHFCIHLKLYEKGGATHILQKQSGLVINDYQTIKRK